VAASFTSTAMIRETKHEAAVIEEDIGPDYVFLIFCQFSQIFFS
jgi:hypothetical protein